MFRDYASAAGHRRVEAPRRHGSAVEERPAAPVPRASAQPVLSRALAMTSPAVAVSRPADSNEQEAERVADTLSSGCQGCHESRPCSTCADASTVHRAAMPAGTEPGWAVEAPTGGRALDAGTRAWFEPRLGASLGGVRIHTDGSAAEAARHLRARAFTIGGHIGFSAGEYTPETAGGHGLLAHELAHVVQQSSGQGPAQGPTRPHHLPMLQRKPDEGAGSGESEEFDPEKERDSTLSGIDSLISLSDPKQAAFNLRLKLLFQASEPDWPDRDALDTFYEQCAKTAQDEKATIEALGDPDRTDPEAFPTTWSEKLKQHLTMSYPAYLLRRDVEAAQGEMEKSGEDIPNDILERGLPVGFGASLDLRAFQLSNVLGVSFAWTMTPAGTVSVEPGPLMAFIAHALKYLRAINEADSINLWIQGAQSVVQQVEDGELSVDPEAFDSYERMRPLGVSWDEIKSSQVTFTEPLSGRIDPAVAEKYVTSGAALMTFGRSFLHAEDVTTIAGRFIGQADSRIAGEHPILRQMRASRWGHEKGFYLDAVKHELEDIEEHAVEIGVGMAKDVALFTAIQFIPVVNVIADIYMGAQLISDVADTLDELESANEEARNAKTAAALQRAAAHQAAALSSTARKVATAIMMHHATKLAEYTAGKVHGRATKGEGAGAEPERVGVPEDLAKVEERAKQKQAETEKQTVRESGTEKISGELAEDLAKGGEGRVAAEARVTAEGHCKICHSPCKFEIDMSREVLRAAEGTPYKGYAENLLMRIQLLEDAMEASARRGTLKTEYASRFQGALKKLSAEVDAAHGVFVDPITGTRHAAAEEIEGFESRRQHGFMDDPSPYQHTARVERMLEGTAYHERIQDAVVASLPRDRVLTENTVQTFLQGMGVDPKVIPAKSTGIDLYVIDATRGVVTPVDIIGVAGGKSHVAKLHRDFSKVSGIFEQVGLRMTEPIEIEYVGMTFKEAAASIAAELRAFAR
jgi:Domain of unknown function (DUF4157)